MTQPVDPPKPVNPDPLDYTTLAQLEKDAASAEAQGHVMVVAIYTLPLGCTIGPPEPKDIVDSRNGVPPGKVNCVYRFPLAESLHLNGNDAAQALKERFRMASEIQAVVATSNDQFINYVSPLLSKQHDERRPDDC